MEDNITLDDMVEQLGGTPEPVVEPVVTEPAAEPVVTEPVVQPVTEPAAEPQQTPAVDKSQQAFINMRQQNKKYSDMLKGIAGVLGVEGDHSDEANILAALQSKITANEAKQNNVPVEMYERLKQLEQRDQEYTAVQTQQRVASGFEAVKNQFSLTQPELNTFAEDLVKSGRNPLEANLDLVSEYKAMYFDKLVQKAADAAIAAEQERASKANTQSTKPSNKTGNNPTETGDQKVGNVRELENWLRSQV